jgi:alkane 1-monooxygenase
MGHWVRKISPRLTRHAYWLVALLPLLMPAAWAVRGLPGMAALFAWIPLLFLFGLLPVLDTLIGRDASNPEIEPGGAYPDVLIPVAASFVYILSLFWSLSIVGRESAGWNMVALLGWTVSLGNIGGVVAINVAHELIHRRNTWLQRLGGLSLSCVNYAGFKLEHPRWHHVKVATPEDPSSAPKGSTIYTQVPRALLLNTIRAWVLAVENARERGRALPVLNHEMTAWWLLSLALFCLCWAIWGSTVAWVFIFQGLAAASLLEVINFIEHYGLQRDKKPDGRYLPPSIEHSWNADFWLSNTILLQLQRHPDHHVHPTRPFSQLQTLPEAPQLPLGYAALSVIAFVPSLWRRIIHPRLPSREATLQPVR